MPQHVAFYACIQQDRHVLGTPKWLPMVGYYMPLLGMDLVVHHPSSRKYEEAEQLKSGWSISELNTGMAVVDDSYPTVNQALDRFDAYIINSGRWREVPRLIERFLSKYQPPEKWWFLPGKGGPHLLSDADYPGLRP
jgi:hypothetical protein